jgi:hypothetical protein
MLAIRLSEPRKRYLKSLAASLGLSLQEAVEQALDMWVSQHQQPGAPPPSLWHDSALANVGLEGPGRQNRSAQRRKGPLRDADAGAGERL